MSISVGPSGPIPAKIMIVGEAPGEEEERKGEPFVGASGLELTRMLHEVGISRSECFITNVCRVRPLYNDISSFIPLSKKLVTKDCVFLRGKYVKPVVAEGYNMLMKEIQFVKPNIIIALGGTPLWALTGENGIMKWRGSMMYVEGTSLKLIPTIHPAAILRQWDLRAIVVNDLRRAQKYSLGRDFPDPKWNFIIRPTIDVAIGILDKLIELCNHEPTEISFDLETKWGHIDCAGFAWSLQEAICIPFFHDYWSEDQEAELVFRIYKLLTHPNCKVVGQNISYDSQYTYRWWHFIPNVFQDTMISWHVAFAGLKKSLDFQASMLNNYYKQWKPDKAAWKEGG